MSEWHDDEIHSDLRYNAVNDDELVVTTSATTEADPTAQQPRPRNSSDGDYHPLQTCVVLLVYYCISSGIILTTKWLLTAQFPYPLTLTVCMDAIAALWAALVMCGSSRGFELPSKALLRDYVLPIGLCTAFDIGCSKVAAKILTVSFATILKGAVPISSFAWGLNFRLESFSSKIGASLLTISVGIALASLGEGDFEMVGFALGLSSVAASGLRMVLAQRLLQGVSGGGVAGTSLDTTEDHDGNEDSNKDTPAIAATLSPVALTLYTCCITTIVTLPFAIALEGVPVLNDDDTLTEEKDASKTWMVLGIVTLTASLMFALLMSKYWLIRATSSLTLTVSAVFKDLLTIGGGIIFFSDAASVLNVVGFATCQTGMLLFGWVRTKNTSAATEYAPMNKVDDMLEE